MAHRNIKTSDLIWAFAVAPLCPVIVAFVAVSSDPEALPITLAITLSLGYIPTLIIGPPFIRLLKRRNRLTSPIVILSGMGLGVLATLVTLGGMALDSPDYTAALFSPIMLFYGSIAGIAYSLSVSIPFCIIAGIARGKLIKLSEDK